MLLVSAGVLAGCETRYVTLPAQSTNTPPPPLPPPPPPEPPPPETIGASLNELGVQTQDTPRTSNEGVALPDMHSPFGIRMHATVDEDGNSHLGSALELALFGFSLDEENAFLTVIDNLPKVNPGGPGASLLANVLHKRNDDQAPWVNEDRSDGVAPVTRRAAAGGDVDGDGIDELAIARVQPGAGLQPDVVILEITELESPSTPVFAGILPVPATLFRVNDVRIAAGDLDADGEWELIIAVSGPRVTNGKTQTSLLVLDPRESDFDVVHELAFESALNGVEVHAVIETGNLDYDVHEELVLVLNEIDVDITGGNPTPQRAATRLYVFDDAAHGYAQQIADTPTVVSASDSHVAEVADVAIGDIDDDDLNELIVGGLARMAGALPCNFDGVMRYVATMYEFDGRTLAKTAASVSAVTDSIYPNNCQDDGNWTLRYAFVNAVDLDGDLDHEFHVNQYLFTSFPGAGQTWSAAAQRTLARSVFFPEGNVGDLVFDRHTAALQGGDVNGDGRGDLVSFRSGVGELSVYSQTEDGGFLRSARLLLEEGDAVYTVRADRAVNPQILAFSGNIANEGDVGVMEFRQHFLDFSEPLVLAAIAAPPCAEDIGQQTEACTSTWGRSETISIEGEREFKFKAGVTVGLKTGVPEVWEFAVKLNIERESARLKSESYEVTKSVSFETGPLEDSVVYTSIPFDVYEYLRVASTSDLDADPEEAETIYQIMLPREATIRLATAKFYNAHTVERALKIDEAVFEHRAGEIESYPTAAERDQILSEQRSQVDNIRQECPFCWQVDPEGDGGPTFFDGPFRTFDPFSALPGLTSRAVGVGQGSGATEVGVELNVSNGVGRSLDTSAEIELEFEGGPLILGFQIGGGVATSTKLTRTEGSSYVGTVGSIDAEHFLQKQYRFGLFTYLQADPNSGLEFEVINYWVEE